MTDLLSHVVVIDGFFGRDEEHGPLIEPLAIPRPLRVQGKEVLNDLLAYDGEIALQEALLLCFDEPLKGVGDQDHDGDAVEETEVEVVYATPSGPALNEDGYLTENSHDQT